eukprot:gene9284-19266_t
MISEDETKSASSRLKFSPWTEDNIVEFLSLFCEGENIVLAHARKEKIDGDVMNFLSDDDLIELKISNKLLRDLIIADWKHVSEKGLSPSEAIQESSRSIQTFRQNGLQEIQNKHVLELQALQTQAKDEKDTYEAKIADLMAQIGSLERDNEELSQKVMAGVTDTEQLQKELRDLETENKTLKTNAIQHETEKSRWETEQSSWETEKSRWETEQSRWETEKSRWDSYRAKMENMVEALTIQFTTVQTEQIDHNNEYNDLYEKYKQLLLQIEQQQRQLQQLATVDESQLETTATTPPQTTITYDNNNTSTSGSVVIADSGDNSSSSSSNIPSNNNHIHTTPTSEDPLVARLRTVIQNAEKKGLSIDQIFAHFDKDGGGSITTDELASGLKKMPHFKELTNANIQGIVRILDANGSGDISLQEFRALIENTGSINEPILSPRSSTDGSTSEDPLVARLRTVIQNAEKKGLSIDQILTHFDKIVQEENEEEKEGVGGGGGGVSVTLEELATEKSRWETEKSRWETEKSRWESDRDKIESMVEALTAQLTKVEDCTSEKDNEILVKQQNIEMLCNEKNELLRQIESLNELLMEARKVIDGDGDGDGEQRDLKILKDRINELEILLRDRNTGRDLNTNTDMDTDTSSDKEDKTEEKVAKQVNENESESEKEQKSGNWETYRDKIQCMLEALTIQLSTVQMEQVHRSNEYNELNKIYRQLVIDNEILVRQLESEKDKEKDHINDNTTETQWVEVEKADMEHRIARLIEDNVKLETGLKAAKIAETENKEVVRLLTEQLKNSVHEVEVLGKTLVVSESHINGHDDVIQQQQQWKDQYEQMKDEYEQLTALYQALLNTVTVTVTAPTTGLTRDQLGSSSSSSLFVLQSKVLELRKRLSSVSQKYQGKIDEILQDKLTLEESVQRLETQVASLMSEYKDCYVAFDQREANWSTEKDTLEVKLKLFKQQLVDKTSDLEAVARELNLLKERSLAAETSMSQKTQSHQLDKVRWEAERKQMDAELKLLRNELKIKNEELSVLEGAMSDHVIHEERKAITAAEKAVETRWKEVDEKVIAMDTDAYKWYNGEKVAFEYQLQKLMDDNVKLETELKATKITEMENKEVVRLLSEQLGRRVHEVDVLGKRLVVSESNIKRLLTHPPKWYPPEWIAKIIDKVQTQTDMSRQDHDGRGRENMNMTMSQHQQHRGGQNTTHNNNNNRPTSMPMSGGGGGSGNSVSSGNSVGVSTAHKGKVRPTKNNNNKTPPPPTTSHHGLPHSPSPADDLSRLYYSPDIEIEPSHDREQRVNINGNVNGNDGKGYTTPVRIIHNSNGGRDTDYNHTVPGQIQQQQMQQQHQPQQHTPRRGSYTDNNRKGNREKDIDIDRDRDRDRVPATEPVNNRRENRQAEGQRPGFDRQRSASSLGSSKSLGLLDLLKRRGAVGVIMNDDEFQYSSPGSLSVAASVSSKKGGTSARISAQKANDRRFLRRYAFGTGVSKKIGFEEYL